MVNDNKDIGTTCTFSKRILQLKAQGYASLEDVPLTEQYELGCLLLQAQPTLQSSTILKTLKLLSELSLDNKCDPFSMSLVAIGNQCLQAIRPLLSDKYKAVA